MTIPEASAQAEKEAPQPPSSRTRSPAYPAYGLKTSLERAKAVWEHEKRNAAPMAALAVAWGLNVKSSSTLLTVSSLKKFGLLEDVDDGRERLLKLTELALNIILNDQEDSPERIGLLKQCALAPSIHSELWEKYNGELPSDTNLKRYLIIDKNFNASAVDGFINQFRETIVFAKLSQSDKITAIAPPNEEPDDTNKPLFQQKHVVENIKAATAPGTLLGGFIAGANPSTTVLREFNFPLPTGMATLKVPFPLTEDDFENLLKTLNTFKDGLVKRPDPVLLECAQGWEEKARSLAGLGVEFNLIGFDYSFHVTEAKKIAVENNFDIKLDLNKGVAFFRKRPAKSSGVPL